MLDHLEESTRVLDLRRVFLGASAYAAAGSFGLESLLGPSPRAVLILAIWTGAAGVFALRGGRRWIRPAAVQSALAATAGRAWISAESWFADRIERLLHFDPPGLRFSIAEGPCFGPGPMDVVYLCVVLSLIAGFGAVPVGWAARRLFPVQQEGGWPGSGGWRSLCSRRAEGRR
jgi:hypothetical protein